MRNFLAVLAVAILLSPTALAQLDNPNEPTDTTVYFHIFDPFAKFVMNTQPYNASFFEVGGVVFPSNPINGWDFNTVYGFSTAGPVEYDFIEGGKPRFHPERGIAADVQIEPGSTPMVYLYVDPRGIEGGYEHTPAHLPMTFRVQVREGDEPSSDFNQGNLIMEGTYTAYLVGSRFCPAHTANIATGGFVYLTSCVGVVVDPIYGGTAGIGTGLYDSAPATAPDGTPIEYVDENHVIEIAIPLTLAADSLPKDEAFNVRIDWYQELYGSADEDEWQVNNLRLVLAEQYLPRMELSVTNPIYIEFIHPQVAAGTLLIHTGVNSPWGTYDVGADNITLRVDGPSQPQRLEQVVAQNQHVHGLHDQAAEITYLWNFREEGAAEGEYTITMEVPNALGTATAIGQAQFRIDGEQAFGISDQGEIVEPTVVEESNGSPSLAPALLGLALVGLALRRRA